eukprot:5727739-Pyramimonas_sp.AAC.2
MSWHQRQILTLCTLLPNFALFAQPLSSRGRRAVLVSTLSATRCLFLFQSLQQGSHSVYGMVGLPRYPARLEVMGISCYSSKDLLNWKPEAAVVITTSGQWYPITPPGPDTPSPHAIGSYLRKMPPPYPRLASTSGRCPLPSCDWLFAGIVLKPSKNPKHDLHSSKVLERPK